MLSDDTVETSNTLVDGSSRSKGDSLRCYLCEDEECFDTSRVSFCQEAAKVIS